MAEKKEDTGGTASEWWMKYVDQAAAALGKFGEIKLECPRCRKNLREDPKFNIIQEAIRGRYECPGCKYDLKELFTKSAVIIGNTIGKDLPVECPYCGKSAPGNTYGGNVVEGWVICPNCGRDAFDSSAQYWCWVVNWDYHSRTTVWKLVFPEVFLVFVVRHGEFCIICMYLHAAIKL